MTAYLSLGSNLGDRRQNLEQAIESLLGVTNVSSFYETEPAEVRDQPWFLNCAVQIDTELTPGELLCVLQGIERRMGRVRDIPKGPRIVDIDILFYGDEIVNVPGLKIPHPRMAKRRFVLEPLAEIAPDLRNPETGRKITEMLAASEDTLAVRKAS